MKRGDLLRKIRKAARQQDVNVEFFERTNHTGIQCGQVRTTVGRHTEIPDRMAEVICKQLEPALGKRWWK
ncbi:ribonuclease PH [Halopolyspora algeriensis]|uniref:ribonuclease PH n=1 Tax=Halopolyspora algeriensis TaxID=1500506 RepID=UPI0011C07DBF|nr:ribonuclease PH [Halopolyspora algeriensis]